MYTLIQDPKCTSFLEFTKTQSKVVASSSNVKSHFERIVMKSIRSAQIEFQTRCINSTMSSDQSARFILHYQSTNIGYRTHNWIDISLA